MPGNAAIVRRGYEAFNTRDLRTLAELFGDKVSWHTPGRTAHRANALFALWPYELWTRSCSKAQTVAAARLRTPAFW